MTRDDTTLTDVPPVTAPQPVVVAGPRHRARPARGDFPRGFWPVAACVLAMAAVAGLATAPPETVRPGRVAVPEVIDLDQPDAATTTVQPSRLRPVPEPIGRRELPATTVPSPTVAPATATPAVATTAAPVTVTTGPPTTAAPLPPPPSQPPPEPEPPADPEPAEPTPITQSPTPPPTDPPTAPTTEGGVSGGD